MIAVIRKGIVEAVHEDGQKITEYHYPGCEIVFLPGVSVELGGSDLRDTLSAKDQALATLAVLDAVLPRCVEDLIATLVLDESALPRIMRERLNQKRAARSLLAAVDPDEGTP